MNQNRSLRFSSRNISPSLTRWLPALALCGVVALALAGTAAGGAAEATARMEQLAGKIARAEVLHPDTVQRLEQVLDMPQYDCARVHCNAGLGARNQAARARLEKAIAGVHQQNVIVEAASR